MLETWRFGTPRNYYIGTDFAAALKAGGSMDQTARTPENLFKMLLTRRIDIAVAETDSLRLGGTTLRDAQSKIVPLPNAPRQELPMYIAFRKQGNGIRLAEQFAAAYAAWRQTEEYALLVQRYAIAKWLPDDYQKQIALPLSK